MERPAPSAAEFATPALDRILQRCLAKDPDERWQTARDLRAELLWTASFSGGAAASAASLELPAHNRAKAWPRVLLARVCGLLALNVLLLLFWRKSTAPEQRSFHWDLDRTSPLPHLLSPDGRWLLTMFGGLRVKPASDPRWRDLPGTEGASWPFWSSDSTQIGFFQDDSIRMITMESVG